MEILHYPLLCWKLDSQAICGHLVGRGYEMVGTGMRKLKTAFTNQLKTDYEAGSYGANPRIKDPSLKIFNVWVRPAYKEKDGVYPGVASLRVPVAAVFGETGGGYFECFLPLLDHRFFYYRPDQLQILIEHFTRDRFMGKQPEEIHRYVLPSEPWLEEVKIRVRVKKKQLPYMKKMFDGRLLLQVLPAVAEQLPYPRSLRRKIKIFPDVAWEQGETIRTVVGKIVEERANLLLVGDRGVGKSAIILESIRKINTLKKIHAGKRRTTFWRSSPHRMTAGARYLGDWQETSERVIGELKMIKGILWLVDFVDLLRVVGEGPEDSLAAFMTPFLEAGDLQVVSEVTPREFESVRNLLPGFADHFQTIFIKEMEQKRVLNVLGHFKDYAGKNLEVEIEQEALESTYSLLRRYVKYESFPGKAVTFLSGCLNEAFLEGCRKITRQQVIDAFAAKTGMMELLLRDDLLLDETELREYFAKRIIGQDEALERLCNVVKVFKTGLNDPGKPISTMIFAGPTGVGKTATTRALARYFFGKGQRVDPLIRLDMSEFQHPFQIYRLIGGGDRDPGKLIKQVRERPFSVVLFDEIEKADSSIFDALMTVLDEGFLVDAYGRVTDFRNTVIIMTSNLGAGEGGSVGFVADDRVDYSKSIRSFFRPEFFNRIDEVVIFRPLGSETVRKITMKELGELAGREGFEKRGLTLEFDDGLVEFIIEDGFDRRYGARPLQRAIERHVVAALAKYLLDHKGLKKYRLLIGYQGGEIIVRRR